MVDINLFNAGPFPRVSVHVGTTWTLVGPFLGSSPKNNLRLKSTAEASRVEITRDCRSQSFRVSSSLNHGESQGSGSPSMFLTNARPPLACLSVHSWSRVPRMYFHCARVVSTYPNLCREVRQEELDVCWNQSDRISRMEGHETVVWTQERALVLERPSHEHHPTESLLERADVD